MDPSVDYQKENNGLEVFTTSESSGVSFPDFFDDHSIDSLDRFVFSGGAITGGHSNGLNNGYQSMANTSDNTPINTQNQYNREKTTDEELTESVGCDVPFEYVIHEQESDGYNHLTICLIAKTTDPFVQQLHPSHHKSGLDNNAHKPRQ